MTGTSRRRSTRVLAVPLLGEQSGGVGQASALLWRAFETTWPVDRELVTLLRDGQGGPDGADKIRYGAAMAVRQALGQARWILFAHLGLARVERYVPAGIRAPYAVFLHGIECWNALSPADAALLRGARLRLANSDYTAQRTMRAHPDIGPITSCPLALAPELMPAADVVARPATPPYVLVVGRMSAAERYKGHDELIGAWPAVVAERPDAELVIAGEGDDRARLERTAEAGGAGHRIRFTGFVDRATLHRLYAGASAFALPSRGEGFGLVYLEAMAYGLPCVASSHDAGAEVVADQVTGFVVDPDDADALGRALVQLLADPALRQRFGAAGRRRLATRYGFDRFQQQLAGLLSDAFEPAIAGVEG